METSDLIAIGAIIGIFFFAGAFVGTIYILAELLINYEKNKSSNKAKKHESSIKEDVN